jgi:hypothetical protein
MNLGEDKENKYQIQGQSNGYLDLERARDPGKGCDRESGGGRGGGRALRGFAGRIGHGIDLAVAEVECLGLGSAERAGAAAAEDGQLVAGFVDGAAVIDALRYGQSGAASVRCGDELWRGSRAEPGEMRRVVPPGK